MQKTSAKQRIVILAIVWLMVIASMFLYFFGFLDASNLKIASEITQKKTTLAALQSQRYIYSQGQSDLEKLKQETLQPQDFFTRDVNLVDEIQALDDLSQKTNVKLNLAGISGEASTSPKAPTKSPIAQISYNMSLYGSLSNVAEFLAALKHLPFVTNTDGLSVSAGDNGNINAALGANFYIRY